MRRFLLAFCVLLPAGGAATTAARAQPWANDAARMAGRQALAAAAMGRWGEAEGLAGAADPLARKLVLWQRLQSRTGGATAAEIVGFIEANPDWPAQDALARRAEELLVTEPDDGLVLRWAAAATARQAPRTLEGALRLADALARGGRGTEAAAVLRAAWTTEAGADAAGEDAFLARHAAMLTGEDHWRRFDRLVFAREMAAAARQAARLDGSRGAAAQARLAFAADRPDAEAVAAAVGNGAAAGAPDLGLVHDRARWLRRRERDAEAAALWRAEGEAAQREMTAAQARAVWAERQVLARRLLRLGDARAAYGVAAAHGQATPGEPRQEAEFLAGFIALRRLEDPAAAARHFEAVGRDSHSVITRARSGYWQGRALTARGDEARAREHYAAAAALPVAFYGQLAALAAGEDAARLAARIAAAPAPAVSADQAAGFGGRELARAVVTLADLGESRRARMFLLRLRELAAEPADQLLAARLAALIGRPDHAVWIARRAGADGLMLLAEGWPMPYRAPAAASVEAAMVFAVTRQESNFDTEAVSSANARGLMQLLPSTAQQVARRLGIPHQLPMLTGSPGHNLRLGAAYLEEMLGRYDGSLALAAAAYNAGPRRVDEWLATNGDPRAGAVDKIDWIELIPFAETRNYVQRVIENTVIYRARDPAGGAVAEHPLARWLRSGS